LAIDGQASRAPRLRGQIEQQQDRLEGSFGGEELLQTETDGSQVVLEFGDAIFLVGPAVVVAPDLLRRIGPVGDEDAKRLAGYLEQFAA